jgi:hypothetical protein
MGKSVKFDSDSDFDPRQNWKRERNVARKHKEAKRASVFSRDVEENSLDKGNVSSIGAHR